MPQGLVDVQDFFRRQYEAQASWLPGIPRTYKDLRAFDSLRKDDHDKLISQVAIWIAADSTRYLQQQSGSMNPQDLHLQEMAPIEQRRLDLVYMRFR